MEITVIVGAFEADDRIEIQVADEQAYVPEVVSDLLRRCGDTALRMHHDLHPTDA